MDKQSYYENLIKVVIEASVADTWESAVLEWEIVDCTEDESASSQCVCKHEGLRYLYKIRNRNNKNILFPIGSTCIKKFGRNDLDEELSVMEQMFSLLHAVERRERIELTSKYFSRKLLEYLYEKNVFVANKYNGFDGYNDYEFLLKMFNKVNKADISDAQHRKTTAIIMNSILPYLRKRLKNTQEK
ncbi:MAG: hypothetical protein IJ207_03980 [Treponema sp.]|uniref:hypothetical protein n=1 Tax=Treponema sp. TaxID=166 RepID=UPI0025D4B59F|nr:hypothetical protein [Treponema sp.]MBQ9281340.1 hypothetical protein [Treponema sp.]